MEKPDCVCPVCSEVFDGEEGVTAYLPVGANPDEQSLYWVCRSCGPEIELASIFDRILK